MSNDCCDYGRSVRCTPGSSSSRLRKWYSNALAGVGSDIGKQVLASSIGSIVTTLTLNPLSVMKIRLQTSVEVGNGLALFSKTLSSVYAKEGLKGFWSGSPTGLAMSIPNTVVYMSAYESCKGFYSPLLASTAFQSFSPAMAGATARFISVTVISPMELIRTIQGSGVQQSFLFIGRGIVQGQGLQGLYRGWTATVLRDVPFSAIYWYAFEHLKPLYASYLQREQPSSLSLVTFLAGSSGGLLAAFVSHPFDVLKTQAQSSIGNGSSYSSLGGLYRLQGLSGLYRGLGLRLVTVIPACGIIVTVYEAVKALQFT